MHKTIFDFSSEVADALLNKQKPVVALESTIISHGMPYPENLKCATELEKIVRSNGAVPVTIAIMNGRVKIGLGQDDLLTFASSKAVAKVSTRDISYVIASKANGATTVASTALLASMAGIRVFVIGGIGGVHRSRRDDGHLK